MELYKLIDRKVIDYAEIIVCLFDHCNLRCVFCPQDHTNTAGASREEILSKVPGIVKWINDNPRSTQFKIHIMGGELFQDEWIDQGFLNIYQEFIDGIRARVPQDKNIIPNFVTNLVFDQVNEVKEFLHRNNLQVSISYDPAGRFTKDQLITFKRNVESMKDYISMVSLVLTRQNMDAVTKGDEYFDYLYQTFVTDWDSLIPALDNTIPEKLMPKESELLAFYKVLVDRYPKCLNITYFTEPATENRMSCTRGNSYTVLYDNSNPAGCSGSVLIHGKATEQNWSPIIVQKFFDQNNCFECEYFNRCSFTCFIKNDYKKLVRDVQGCVFKETYKYVESKQKTDNSVR